MRRLGVRLGRTGIGFISEIEGFLFQMPRNEGGEIARVAQAHWRIDHSIEAVNGAGV